MAITKISSSILEDLAITNSKISSQAVTSDKVGSEFTGSSVLNPAATIDVSYTAGQIFTLTPNQNFTLNITNPVVGVQKSIIVTGAGGSYTLALTVGGASGTFNKISGDYDDTSATKNLVSILCVSATEFWYSISQIAT